MNICILNGYLANEPTRKIVGTKGNEVCNFTVGNNEGGKNSQTNFISCSAWSKTADIVEEYFHKGSPIMVTGKLNTYSRKKDDGTYNNGYTVNVSRIDFPLKSKDTVAPMDEHNEAKGNGYQPQDEPRYGSEDNPETIPY